MLTAALLAYSVLTAPPIRDEVFIRVRPGTPIESLSRQIASVGKLEARQRGTTLFTVQLKPEFTAETARAKLSRFPGIQPIEPDDEPVNMNSVRDLNRKIRHLENGENSQPEAGGLDYLEAYRYFVGQRAFPNDSVDWSAFGRARQHVASMRPAFARKPSSKATSPFWQFVGPTNLAVPYRQYFGIGPVSGRVNAVAYDPTNPKIIYAGAAQGGLWQSTDGGLTWNWLSSTWTQLGVSCIVVDPTKPKTIYVGMGDYPGFISSSFGIMKTTDGGQSWSEVATPYMGKIGVPKILMDPTNHNVLIAGTGDQYTNGAVYRSIDGGNTWTTVISNDSSQFRLWPTMAASKPNGANVRFYAISAGWGNTGTRTSRLYTSDDHGATWQNPASPVNTDGNFHRAYWVATSKTDPNRVLILDSENVALYSSDDQGATWADLSAKLPSTSPNFTQDWYNYYLETGTRTLNGTTSDVLYLGEIDLTESFDGGNTWQSIGGPTHSPSGAIVHNDQHAFTVCPTDPTKAIFSGDGGFYSLAVNSGTGQNSVTPLSQNLGVSMFYKIAAHPTNPSILLGGTQDNASPLSTGDLSNWLNVGGGDGGGCAINPSNPLIGYVTAQATNGVPYVTRTGDGWQNQYFIPPPVQSTDVLAFVSALAIAPSSPSNMYWASNYLYRWNEDTQQWTARLGNQMLSAGPATNGVVQAVAVAPTDSNRIYTGSSDGAVWMTKDGGNTWVQLNPNGATLPNNRSITSLSVSPASADDLLVGYSGTTISHLWHCTNVSAAVPPVFTDVSGSGTTSLPDASLNAIARDMDQPNSSYWVGTDVGVFRSTDFGATWQDAGVSIGLPSCIVNDIVAVPGTRYINCGTYGVGMWRLYIPVPPPPLQSLTVSPTAVLGGGTAAGLVTIATPAPSSGTTVQLTSTSSAATVPLSITIPSAATSASFTIGTTGVLTATQSVISATLGTITKPATLTIQPTTLASLLVSPSPIVGGTSATGTLTLHGIAPPAGVTVQLNTTSSSITIPQSVKVPAGGQSTTFTVASQPVQTATSVSITATGASGQLTDIFNIVPSTITAISFSPGNVVGSSTTNLVGTLTFNGPTSAAGVNVTLKSSDPSALKVPSSVHVTLTGPALSFPFAINHSRVTSSTQVKITAQLGSTLVTGTVTVLPFALSGFSIYPPSVPGGTSATGNLDINAIPTTKSGVVLVKLASTSKAVVVPASVSFTSTSGGSKAVTIKSVAQATNTTGTVTASIGTSSMSATLQVTAPVLTLFTVHPATVVGKSGTVVTGMLTLSGPAPAAGSKVSLMSSSPGTAAVPASVVVPGGRTSVAFTVRHFKVSQSQTVTFAAKAAAVSLSTNLSVTP